MTENTQSGTNDTADSADVGTTVELVARTRRFCVDCTRSIVPAYLQKKDFFRDYPLVGTVESLIVSLEWTTDNI